MYLSIIRSGWKIPQNIRKYHCRRILMKQWQIEIKSMVKNSKAQYIQQKLAITDTNNGVPVHHRPLTGSSKIIFILIHDFHVEVVSFEAYQSRKSRGFLSFLLLLVFFLFRHFYYLTYWVTCCVEVQWQPDTTKCQWTSKMCSFITRVHYIEDLFHTFCYHLSEEYHWLYRGHRYIQ